MIHSQTYTDYQPRLGVISTIASLAAAAANIGLTTYGTIEQIELAKEQQELQEDLARQRAALEEEMIEAQMRITEMQASGLMERQGIELDLAKAQAESARRQLERLDEIEGMRAQLEKEKIRREQEQLEFVTQLEREEQERQLQTLQQGAVSGGEGSGTVVAVGAGLALLGLFMGALR